MFKTKRPLFVAFILAAALSAFGAVAAFANHPILSGSLGCSAGQQVVTWSVTDSETTVATGGNGRTMTIEALSVSQGTVLGLSVGDVVQPQPLPGSTVTGTTTLPGTTTGTVTLTVTGHFFEPGGADTGIVDTESIGVTLSGACGTTPPTVCPQGQKLNFRWHYSANGSSGSWSGTQSTVCSGSISEGPQAMEGDLKVAPGTTLIAGYDFTSPGNNTPFSVTVTNPQVVFTLRCVSGATPSQSTLTVSMPTTTYPVTGSEWVPSGDQHSPLVYQGSVTIPDVCSGGQVRLDKGGTFSAGVQ
jgi:hypothetical protein